MKKLVFITSVVVSMSSFGMIPFSETVRTDSSFQMSVEELLRENRRVKNMNVEQSKTIGDLMERICHLEETEKLKDEEIKKKEKERVCLQRENEKLNNFLDEMEKELDEREKEKEKYNFLMSDQNKELRKEIQHLNETIKANDEIREKRELSVQEKFSYYEGKIKEYEKKEEELKGQVQLSQELIEALSQEYQKLRYNDSIRNSDFERLKEENKEHLNTIEFLKDYIDSERFSLDGNSVRRGFSLEDELKQSKVQNYSDNGLDDEEIFSKSESSSGNTIEIENILFCSSEEILSEEEFSDSGEDDVMESKPVSLITVIEKNTDNVETVELTAESKSEFSEEEFSDSGEDDVMKSKPSSPFVVETVESTEETTSEISTKVVDHYDWKLFYRESLGDNGEGTLILNIIPMEIKGCFIGDVFKLREKGDAIEYGWTRWGWSPCRFELTGNIDGEFFLSRDDFMNKAFFDFPSPFLIISESFNSHSPALIFTEEYIYKGERNVVTPQGRGSMLKSTGEVLSGIFDQGRYVGAVSELANLIEQCQIDDLV